MYTPMKKPTSDEQRQLVRQWEKTGPLLERIRREALRDKPYDWREVDAVLELGFRDGIPTRSSEGIIEMQRWFMKAAKRNLNAPVSTDDAGSIP